MRNLYQGDCLEVMKEIPDKSIDLVLTDPPYGTTACKWDTVIDLDLMWNQLKRIIKPNGAIVMTASQPFTTRLISSNYRMLKYCLVWRKSRKSHFAQAPYRFLTEHEDIVVFSFGGTSKNARNRMAYNPQGLEDICRTVSGVSSSDHRPARSRQSRFVQTKTNYPKSILEFRSVINNGVHPTQKPVALMEYMIRTYTDKFETVLDFSMGSGTTGVAARNLARYFIGIELDAGYYEIAKDRIENG